MRKISIVTIVALLITSFLSVKVNAITFPYDGELHSDAVYLVNLDTDTVIYEKNSDKMEYPASLTKIMTAILTLENIPDLKNTTIEAPSYIFDELYQVGASTADFRPYEIASAEDLMYGMMLQSACEAASILGDYVGQGSISNFVDMMNSKALELGATDTHFTNAHGLFDPEQYTTAKDIATITEYALTLPRFKEITNTYSYELAPTNKHSEPRTVVHTNFMLNKSSKYYYPYIQGIKTGTLDEAGRCLVTTASKDGYNYLCVVMGSPLYDEDGNKVFYNLEDTKNLYEWAFNDFSYKTILSDTEEIGEVSVNFSDDKEYVLVKPSEEFSLLWPSSIDESTVQRVIDLDEDVDAPVEKGQKLGTMKLMLSGEELKEVDLVSTDSVERSALKYNLYIAKQFTSSTWFKIAIGVVIVLIILYIAFLISINKKKKRRKIRSVNKRRPF